MTQQTLAFVFPGQGSQKVGMLADIATRYPIIEETFREASEALGFDVWNMVQSGEQEQLNLTENTQPVLLAASVALWRVWQQRGGTTPHLLAGHSLGEFSALVAAESISFVDAVVLVRDRGRFMQTTVPVGEGAMAAVLGLDDATITKVCNDAAFAGVVEAVNFNSPGQVVIAGSTAGVQKAIDLCKEAGAKRAMPLPVSAPFHTSLMKPAGEKLAEKIAGITVQSPKIPVVHNVHAQTETNPEKIKALLVDQIHSPVKWVSCVEFMVAAGVEDVVECGPGKVLSGLNKRIQKSLNIYSLEDQAGLEKALETAAT